MTFLRRVRIYLFGPDRDMLDAPAPEPQPILSDEQRQRLRLELQMKNSGDEVILLTHVKAA